ncbi:hypothetical protein PIB30_033820 [Stylosanthes scabra]|uniref:F-box domain-containing protein n=1 Tax=Stylosanthes scabra TaxID=79078 RepID=A0ABU6YBD0_9FABA|nr:hypothetical protein [Stylosanthes scabra]
MDLPPELVREILLRLPVKSLVRFKCVSKQWLSLLSDSHFAESHFDLATNNNNNKLMYLSSDCSKVYSVKITGTSLHHDNTVQLHSTCNHESTRIVGSCRGFLLLQKGTVLVLWNPVTDFHTMVIYPSIKDYYFPCSYFFTGGVGYEKSNDDYLIVIGMIKSMVTPCWKYFSVRTNSWKEIEGGDRFGPCFCHNDRFGLVYNDAIHWLTLYIDSDYQLSLVIVAFDTATKTLSEIPLPCPLSTRKNSELGLLGGRGCFGIYNQQEIWVMKEYKVESSWTKLNILLLFPSYRSMIPLCFGDSGDEVVCRKDKNKELVKFSKKGILGKCGLNCCKHDPIVITFTESLFSLPSSY